MYKKKLGEPSILCMHLIIFVLEVFQAIVLVLNKCVFTQILSAESDRELEELGISDDYASVTTSSGIFSLLRVS